MQKPDALSLSGNIKKFILSSGTVVTFQLKEGSIVLLDATYEPGTDGRVTIDVRDIVESRLSYLISHENFYQQQSIVKIFTVIIDGVETTFRAIRSGVANLSDTPGSWLTGNFLTWQPVNKPVTYYSPEWITYYATNASTLKLTAYFNDGTSQDLTLGNMTAGNTYTANVQYAVIAGRLGQLYPQHYEVYVESSSGVRLSYIQRYLYSEVKSEQEQWFLFENSLGGLDTIRAYGDTDFTGEHQHKISKSGDLSFEYDIDTNRRYNKNTGYLNEYERRWLLDFFPSRAKYIYTAGALRKIVVSDSDVKYSASDLPSSYTFKYSFSEATPFLNLIRNGDSIPESITIPDIDSPDFSFPPRLSEYPRVQIGEGVILPAFEPNSEIPKTTTIGAILAAALELMLDAIPGSDGTPGSGGQLVNVVKENDPVAGTDKNVFTGARVLREILEAIQDINLDDKYLSKIKADEAQKVIKFLEGIIANGLSKFADVELENLVATKVAELKKGYKTGVYGQDENGDFKARKVTSPEAVFGNITLQNGFKSPVFASGLLGEGFNLRKKTGTQNQWVLELQELIVNGSLNVNELIVKKWSWVGAGYIFSAAGFEIDKVEELPDRHRVYPKKPDENDFKQYDQALCQSFKTDGTSGNLKRYWRLVLDIAPDRTYIDLSKTDTDGSVGIPSAGDDIIQLGYRGADYSRKGAIVISSIGETGPYMQFLSGIDSYDFSGKIDTQIGRESWFTAEKFVIRTPDGKTERVANDKGVWKSGETYFYYDRVSHAGALWLSMVNNNTTTPSETSGGWVKQTNVKVGGKNLLREYDLRFGGKYWGVTLQENVNYVEVDIESIMPALKYLSVAPASVNWEYPQYESTLLIKSTGAWSISSRPSWLRANALSGEAGELSLKIDTIIPYDGRTARNGSIVFQSAGLANKTISVSNTARGEYVNITGVVRTGYEGGNIAITGETNSRKLTFSLGEGTINITLPNNYIANSASTVNGADIAGDPGASGKVEFRIIVSIPANEVPEEKSRVLTVTANGGQISSCEIKQDRGKLVYRLLATEDGKLITTEDGKFIDMKYYG